MNQRGHSVLYILISVIILVLIGGGSYYLGVNKRQGYTQVNDSTVMPKVPINFSPTPPYNSKYPYGASYTILSGCNGTECLFKSPSEPWVVEGFAKLKGYYKQYDSTDYGTKVTCDALVTTGGSDILIGSFKKQIDNGNTLNKYDNNQNLMVNIDLTNIDIQTKQKIVTSNIINQIELGMIRVTPQPRGASTCSSFVNILYAK